MDITTSDTIVSDDDDLMDPLARMLASMATEAERLGDDYDPNEQPSYTLPSQPQTHSPPPPPTISQYPAWKTYMLLLSGPISTPSQIQSLAQLPHPPTINPGEDEDGNLTQFCEVDGTARTRITQHLQGSGFEPTFVFVRKPARKQLAGDSWAPFLGVECTLPQMRFADAMTRALPGRDDVPVWYFFYGTLAERECLGVQIGRRVEEGEFVKAAVEGGKIVRWEQYRGLVDGPGLEVEGKAFMVRSQEEEDALRLYETEAYEVVRCEINMERTRVFGLTFRLIEGDQS